MSIFRTVVHVPENARKISYHTPLLFIGSCFTEYIGQFLYDRCFNIISNPFGVMYNPLSIAAALNRMRMGNPFTLQDLCQYNNRWFSFMHDTSFSSHQCEECLEKINASFQQATNQIQNTHFMVITFGSSWAYHHKKNHITVSNCHKLPAGEFNRYIISANKIAEEYASLLSPLLHQFPEMHITFSVSPVRHWHDGPVENQRSKANLILAIQHILNQFPENTSYFPAYEIMMDDLRDYRFYNEDMLHPSHQALQYIWEKYSTAFISAEAIDLMNDIEKINKSLLHRPFNPNTPEYNAFIQKTIREIDLLQDKHPYLNLQSLRTKIPDIR